MVLMVNKVHERIAKSAQTRVERELTHLTFQAMGTQCRASFAAPSPQAGRNFTAQLLDWVAEFESTYSRFLPESVVSRINQNAGIAWVEIDPNTERLLALCAEMNFLTRGVFDPTALPLIQLWNWKAAPPVIPTADEIKSTLQKVGWRKVQRRPGAIFLPEPGMALDLGGIGKEYAVDMAIQLAVQSGVADVLIDFGQDLKVHGIPPGRPAWHIGLEDPLNPGKCWTGLAVLNAAVASSGDYFRRFELNGRRYGHILDPRTGYPVDNGCRAVSVIAPNCTIAGILSTAAFVLGAKDGLALIETQPGASGCITTDTSRIPSRRFYEYVVH